MLSADFSFSARFDAVARPAAAVCAAAIDEATFLSASWLAVAQIEGASLAPAEAVVAMAQAVLPGEFDDAATPAASAVALAFF